MSKIFLSIPILDKPELKSIYSIYQAMLSCKQHKIRIYFNEGDSLISRVRNCHITSFYCDYPEYDYFISIDSDLEVVNCTQNDNLFEKLLSLNLDFTGGLYSLKKESLQGQSICSSQTLNLKRNIKSFNTRLIPMRWLSSGCWCIKRSVITKMIDAYPDLTYEGEDLMFGKKVYGLCVPEIFKIETDDGSIKSKYLSEDWSFCERWTRIGGKIFADSSIKLNHIGKKTYTL